MSCLGRFKSLQHLMRRKANLHDLPCCFQSTYLTPAILLAIDLLMNVPGMMPGCCFCF